MMKRVLSILLCSILLSFCLLPAAAEQLPGTQILQAYEKAMTATWQLHENCTRLARLPECFTYGDNDDYMLFMTGAGHVYLVWRNQDGKISTDQFLEVAFSSDWQYLMLTYGGEKVYIYTRQP